MSETRLLLFDVFGTLVDWRTSLVAEASRLGAQTEPGVDWAAVIDDWRRAYQPAMDRVLAGSAWRDLDALQRETLAAVLADHAVPMGTTEREVLVQAWRRLQPWPDTRAGLERLRSRYRTATLSNGHMALLVDLFRFADLRVDAVLSAQLADSYKPDPKVYLRAAELLGCPPEHTAMVAAHAQDLTAAAAVGLRPIFVRRPAEWGVAGGSQPPTGLPGLIVADGLGHLADVLGC
ncbi:MAG TPA: haloacid dehalogenase type II [Mycobacteriales bacterium]|nr:haloacid dehalogenase type II [Mycobacteriales bacterium]